MGDNWNKCWIIKVRNAKTCIIKYGRACSAHEQQHRVRQANLKMQRTRAPRALQKTGAGLQTLPLRRRRPPLSLAITIVTFSLVFLPTSKRDQVLVQQRKPCASLPLTILPNQLPISRPAFYRLSQISNIGNMCYESFGRN
jgi:hypothetical protein